MRKVNKGQRLTILDDFLSKNSNPNWQTLHEEQGKPTFNEMRLTILVEEQDNRCAYTELPVFDVDDAHIDHYKVRARYPNLIFDWDNLLCSINSKGNEFGATHKDSEFKIGNKLNTYNEIFNPAIETVENHFYYNQLGEIEAKFDDSELKVTKTVKVFNLNHPSLKSKREAILREIEDIKSQVSNLSNEDIERVYQNRGFLSVIRQALSE
jgi:uncharacterized protein (TIGR02646 family)